jgi:raffinose/stachyose/melibiose transport system permease protein
MTALPVPRAPKGRLRFSLGSVPRVLTLTLFTLLFIFPLIWLLYNSFKTNSDLYNNPWALPTVWHLENYHYAWSVANVSTYFLNSVKVCGCAITISLLLSTTAAFAITRLRWKLAPVVFSLFVISMMIPGNATLIPQFLMFSKLGLINRHIALIILYAVGALPISIFILAGFMKTFPTEIEESAVIDGASMGKLFFSMTLPVSRSAIATVAIYTFITMWNDLTTAVVFLSDNARMTLPYGLKAFQGQYATDYVSTFAAVAIATVPTVLIFTLFNKQIIAGVTAGSVKE